MAFVYLHHLAEMSPHSDGRACPEMVDTIEHYEMGLVPATITMTNRTFRGRREQSCSNGNSNLARCTLTVTSILTAFIILLCGQSNQLGFQPRLITRFCYNSPNLSTINVGVSIWIGIVITIYFFISFITESMCLV